jgi:hypothetical protein
MRAFAGAGPWRGLAALALVYALGYVVGSLLVAPADDRRSLSLAVIRLIAGLLLATIGFLGSLLVVLPWFTGPALLFCAAIVLNGRAALAPPRPRLSFSRNGALAGLLIAVVLSPLVIASLRMAPGEFAPVFYNVDTAYFMEKVHALVKTDTYPPESLGFAGGLFTYHYGAQGLAALLARGSGLAPHHVVFLIMLPLLAAGIAAAAVAAAERLSPALPPWAAVGMLLISVPTLWYPFWAEAGPALIRALSLGDFGPLDSLTGRDEIWGFTSIPGHNVAAQFIVLASLVGVMMAPTHGWRLAAFLIGSAIIFKAPTGIALCAGLAVALVCDAAVSRNPRLLRPILAVAATFAFVYGAFFLAPGVPGRASALEPALFFHLRTLGSRDGLRGFGLDMLWLLLPIGLLLITGRQPRTPRSLPLLAFALTPLVLVNVLRLIDSRPGGYGTDDNWLQVLVPVPVLLHACVLGVAGERWTLLGRRARSAILVVIAATILPPAFVAASYARVLVVNPAGGHEFVDNRSLAEALSAIPLEGTLIVTNDLRYPAEGFWRDNRQMQIPALFGHRAFAVNFEYEDYDASPARRQAQALLQQGNWTDATDRAAREHGWTHLLIRNDYKHPNPIPLDKVFDNGTYSVYGFPTTPTRTSR